MTNWEKYKDEIMKITACTGLAVVKGKPEPCCYTHCAECDLNATPCDKLRLKWLDEEYKEPSPYDDWEIDDKIEVRDTIDNKWYKRHFAGVGKNGECLAWDNGKTSWTLNHEEDLKVAWDYAKKVEE